MLLVPFRRVPLLTSFWLGAAALLIAVAGLVAPASALTVAPRDFDGLVSHAEIIFKGTVVAQTSLWTGGGSTRQIVTRVTFQVAETYKGTAASPQTLEFLGGTVDGQTLLVPGLPKFVIGETAVLFVVGNGQQICPLVGAFQGRFHVRKDAATALERIYAHDGSPVMDTTRIGDAGKAKTDAASPAAVAAESPLPADTFRQRIAEKLRERRALNLPEVARDN